MRAKKKDKAVRASKVGFGFNVPLSGYIILIASIVFIGFYFITPTLFTASPTEMLVSLIYFISLAYLLGYSLTKDVLSTEDPIEKAAMRMGFGLSTMPLLFVIMETAHVPLRWYIPLAMSAIRPVYDGLMGFEMPKLNLKGAKIRIDLHSSLAVLIFVIAFALALYGSYRYPYLEDGDPWEHAAGVKYISLFGTYTPPQGVYVAHYLKPYPPSYDVLLGLINQLNGSVSWTLKAYNSILIGLTYLFAYFFVKRISGDSMTALYASIILFMIPSFGSHTIWAQTLSALVLFPVFYAADKIREDNAWAVLTCIFLASSLLIQPIMSLVMGVFYIIFTLARAYSKRDELKTLIIIGAAALALSAIYWIPVVLDPSNQNSELGYEAKEFFGGTTKVGVDSTKLPTMAQVFFPKDTGDIFMQQGLGLFAVILAILCLDKILRVNPLRYAKENPSFTAIIGWLIITSIALFSGNLSISLHPTRFWGIVAIPLAIVSGYMIARVREINWPLLTGALIIMMALGYQTFYPLFSGKATTTLVNFTLWAATGTLIIIGVSMIFAKKNSDLKWIKKAGLDYVPYLLCVGLLLSSGWQKIQVQTSIWPSDIKAVLGEDYRDYLRVLGLPQNTLVYNYCLDDKFMIGLDRLSLPWDAEVVNSRKRGFNIDPAKLHTLLRSRGYDWAMFDASCLKQCIDSTNHTVKECNRMFAEKLKGLEDSKLFRLAWKTNSTITFKVT
jgi:hypothetical protein